MQKYRQITIFLPIEYYDIINRSLKDSIGKVSVESMCQHIVINAVNKSIQKQIEKDKKGANNDKK